MAAPTVAERGKSFLQGVMDKIDPARKAHAEALLEDAGLLEYIGAGALRQDEFSRSKDALAQETARLNTRKSELDDWYENKAKPAVERAQHIIETGGADPALDPEGDPKVAALDPVKLNAEIDARARTLAAGLVAESERNAIPFIAELNDLSMRHYATFGEQLDTKALTADPRVFDGKHGLRGTYDAIYGERYTARDKAARDKELADARAAGATEAEAKLRAQMTTTNGQPFPIMGAPETSPMGEALKSVQTVGADGKTAPRDFRNRVDERAAAVEYHTLAQAGG